MNNFKEKLNNLNDDQIKDLIKQRFNFDIDPQMVRNMANMNISNNIPNQNFKEIKNNEIPSIMKNELFYYKDLIEINISKEIKKLENEIENLTSINLNKNNKIIVLIEIKDKTKELLSEYLYFKPLISLIIKLIKLYLLYSKNNLKKLNFVEEFKEYFEKIENYEYFKILGELLEKNNKSKKLNNLKNFANIKFPNDKYFNNLQIKDLGVEEISDEEPKINDNNQNNDGMGQMMNNFMGGNNNQSNDMMKSMMNNFMGGGNNDMMKSMMNNFMSGNSQSNQNTPNLGMDSKNVDFAMNMVKNNPALIKGMLKNLAQSNPSLNFLANLSEGKISFLMKIIIYLKNIISFLIQQKQTIMIIFVSFLIYKLI